MDHLPTAIPSRASRRAQRAHGRWAALGDWLAGAPLLPGGWLYWPVGPLAAWRVRRLGARCARLEAAERLAGLAAAHAPEPLTLDITYDTSGLERVLARGRLAAHNPGHDPTHTHAPDPSDPTCYQFAPDAHNRVTHYHGHPADHHDPPAAL
jgi:hypothetical protein